MSAACLCLAGRGRRRPSSGVRRDEAASQAAISAPRALALLDSYLVHGNVKAAAGLLKRLASRS
jgi:hypothetical protein